MREGICWLGKVKEGWRRKEGGGWKIQFSCCMTDSLPANQRLSFNTQSPSCGFLTIAHGGKLTTLLPCCLLYCTAHTLHASLHVCLCVWKRGRGRGGATHWHQSCREAFGRIRTSSFVDAMVMDEKRRWRQDVRGRRFLLHCLVRIMNMRFLPFFTLLYKRNIKASDSISAFEHCNIPSV